MPLLSLVIPTLDRQEKVIRAVNSILSQNFKGDLEVIVVDDGSSPPITLPPSSLPIRAPGSCARNEPPVRARRAIPA